MVKSKWSRRGDDDERKKGEEDGGIGRI